MSAEFANRVALVTGGSRCIGRATALRLGGEGADVAISFVSRAAEANEVVQEIRRLGRRALAHCCDVSRPKDVDALVAATRNELGSIDFLAHCGAISNIRDHTKLSFELWRETMDVNLNGTFLVVWAVKDQMIERKFGRIVTVSSVAALRPRPLQIHYATSKAGVIAFTHCCAEAFAAHNIRMNCVAPGLTDTEMLRVLPEERIAAIAKETPISRVGRPEEVAAAIRFLLSDESSFITGQTVMVCGGRVML